MGTTFFALSVYVGQYMFMLMLGAFMPDLKTMHYAWWIRFCLKHSYLCKMLQSFNNIAN